MFSVCGIQEGHSRQLLKLLRLFGNSIPGHGPVSRLAMGFPLPQRGWAAGGGRTRHSLCGTDPQVKLHKVAGLGKSSSLPFDPS